MMNLNYITVFILVLCFTGTSSIAQPGILTFDVIFKNDIVGTLTAKKSASMGKSLSELHIESETKFLFVTIQMESEVAITAKNGILLDGTAYRNANRILHDIHATVHRRQPKVYEIERNGTKTVIKGKDITLCVSDLYFSEPVGVTSVFSTMYAASMPLEKIEDGKYRVIAPDNNNSTFTYKDGKLISVELETLMGKIYSRSRSL